MEQLETDRNLRLKKLLELVDGNPYRIGLAANCVEGSKNLDTLLTTLSELQARVAAAPMVTVPAELEASSIQRAACCPGAVDFALCKAQIKVNPWWLLRMRACAVVVRLLLM
jgi:hypothetical protein